MVEVVIKIDRIVAQIVVQIDIDMDVDIIVVIELIENFII
jgi:hypothetical protein